MTSINRLTQQAKLNDNDLIPIWSGYSGRTMNIPAHAIKEFVKDVVHTETGVKLVSGTYDKGTLTLKLSDNTEVVVTGWSDLTGIDFKEDGAEVGPFKSVNFKGNAVQAVKNGDDLEVTINTAASAPTLALQFSGIYDTLQNLKDAIASPSNNQQAIVLQPSEKYYHGVGGAWIELAPVGSFHPNYLGAYDTVDDLKAAEPSPADESLAIVGTTAKTFYIYTSGDWEQVTHTDLPSIDARLTDNEAKTKDNVKRIEVAEGHLQTLQKQDQHHDQQLSAIGDDITQLQARPQGIELENSDGTKLSDLTSLKLNGAEIIDNGDGTFTLQSASQITVANGQQPDSQSFTGNALIFDGSQVSVDPNDSSVIRIGVHAQSQEGINVGDGANASRAVQTITFNGHTAYGSGTTAEIHIEFVHFKTLTERNAWSTKFGSKMSFDVIALVDADDNGFTQFYKFDAATKSWRDYNAQGVVMSDSNGAIPKNIKTVVFGPGFAIQQAGDQEDAALVTYSESTGIDGIEINGHKLTELNIAPPIQLDTGLGTGNTPRILIDPSAYEPMHKPSFLAYVSETEEVAGKSSDAAKGHHDGAIWFGDIVQPAGFYIQTDKPNKAYGIQEADDLDPNVSGGTNYLVALRIAMKGKAHSDGIVRAYLYDKAVNPFSETGYLKDVNGQVMGYQKSYTAGEELGVIEVVGVVNAKGIRYFTCHLIDSFTDDMINIEDRTEGGSCIMIQAITSEGKTGDGLQQFEIDTKQNIEFSSHYLGVDRASLDWLVSRDMPSQTGNAGAGITMTDGYHFYNISQMKMQIMNGHLMFSDNGADTCDFNFGRIFSAEETQMLRGKTIHVTTTLVDKDSGFEVALMNWTGKPDEYTPEIFTSRNNTIPNFQTGWSKGDSYFISEDVVSGDHTMSKVFTVPANSNNYAVIIYPVAAQQPLTLKLKQLKVDVNPAFIGFAMKAPELIGEAHLYEDTEYKEFVQDVQGFASLRYTINNKPTPMPVGIPVAGKGQADIEIDPKVNPVVGSGARGGEGALTFNVDGNVSMASTYKVFAGESVPSGVSRNVRFWWAKYNPGTQQFTEIPDADVEVQVTGGDKIAMEVDIPAFEIQVSKGEKIAAFAQADIADGAFVQCHDNRSPIVKTTITFKELKASDASDDPDLIVAPIPKALVEDKRVYSFSGNTLQNIKIPLEIPADVQLAEIEVVKHSGTTTTSIRDCEYSYDSGTGILTVHVGNGVADGKVYLTFWSGIA